ncbi:MAG: metallophosphoesterase [Phycisphaerae bacterium]|nr:metallophosphoesterase [Phycisphaerae bacterium]
MDWRRTKVVALVVLAAFLNGRVVAIDVHHYSIGGPGLECFRFAVFTDTHARSDPAKNAVIAQAVDKVIEINSDDDLRNDISFVVVSGDLIHGETKDNGDWKGENDYRLEYEQIKLQLERLKPPPPAGAGIQYIPLIGNHDVWFNFDDYAVADAPPDFPGELFADFFGPQFDELSTELPGFSKQESMPPTNPYSAVFPAPLFQNFAFDFGPHHFICLDFCARDDFDFIQEGMIPRLKKLTGYADLHDFDFGTWSWLADHLAQCAAAGIEDVVIFTHHPPIYQLEREQGAPPVLNIPSPGVVPTASPAQIKGEAHILRDPAGTLTGKTLSSFRAGPDFLTWDGRFIFDGTEADRITGDVILGFNTYEYDGRAEYELFAPLFADHGINIVHWFAGHYHLKGFEWTDTTLNTDVTVVPSITPATRMSTIEFDGSVRINEQPGAVVTPRNNLHGSMAIVQVNALSGADCNGDGCTNFTDFADAVLRWSVGPSEAPAEPLPPGRMLNMIDLAAWAEHWLEGCAGGSG